MGTARLYAAVAAGGFRRYATYRVATAAGVFTNTVFGLILVYTYLALWDERPHLGGYDQAQAVTYVWLGQALFATLAIQGGGFETDLIERIRTGEVAVDLYRPADLQAWWLATDLGRALFQLLGRGVIPFVFGALFFPTALPDEVGVWLAFLVAVALAMVVSYAIRFLVALSGFWLLDGTGALQMLMIMGLFCSGMALPLNAFPQPLGDIVMLLPWSALLQTPADVLMGRVDVWSAFAFQAGWAVVLLAVGRWVQGAATRRVVVQGG
ncbi:ABC-2 type transport system permease protein [Streptomyces sp. B4I13]|uniref:ABC transporter permease n=1 Tax=Streptomyces sp. B4I13 TaxID=3042271 RepID=UPI00277DE040|nr:ABC-2 family transporter protein [Streptomyces sp. B4I13]MDQ0961511.1 ABC-2 type transport system permease protein [Streptomyces sp. B4I13]